MFSDAHNHDDTPRGAAIRTASENDVPVLLELFERSRIEGQLRENDTGADIDHLVAGYLECKDSGFWVAEIESAIVGMIGVQRVSDDSAEIRRLRVRDGFRRKGIGSSLMEQAISFCRERQFLKVVLDVRIERGAALAMFDTFGFLQGREREVEGRKLRDFYLDLYSDTTTDTQI
ncbi:MAG: GNAT family N-acetyltransferase [Planctomycetes bacterium]|nr:GNAT family N-acetyltransferase [Planctomycetota bacterium]